MEGPRRESEVAPLNEAILIGAVAMNPSVFVFNGPHSSFLAVWQEGIK